MSFSGRILRLLVPLLFIAALASCAMFDQDPRQSLLNTKQRLDEAKKDRGLQGESAQILYEADLYWRRAWAARDDAAKANHLLFMAQGKLAMAQSVAALRDAERKLQGNRSGQSINIRSQKRAKEQVDSSGKRTIAVSADTKSPASQSKKTQSETGSTLAANVASRELEIPRTLEDESLFNAAIEIDKAAEKTGTKVSDDATSDLEVDKTQLSMSRDIKTESIPKEVGRGHDILEQEEKEYPEVAAAAAVAIEHTAALNPATQPETHVTQNEPSDSQTASLAKENGIEERSGTEEVMPIKQPDANLPEKSGSTEPGSSSQDPVSAGFRVDIPTYCKSITAMVRGGKKVEEKCRELETSAQKRLVSLKSISAAYASIYKYCNSVAHALGSGYQIMELCVDQELGARSDTPLNPRGFVMGEPGSKTKKAAERPKAATGN